jgi:hypothetical protein
VILAAFDFVGSIVIGALLTDVIGLTTPQDHEEGEDYEVAVVPELERERCQS